MKSAEVFLSIEVTKVRLVKSGQSPPAQKGYESIWNMICRSSYKLSMMRMVG